MHTLISAETHTSNIQRNREREREREKERETYVKKELIIFIILIKFPSLTDAIHLTTL
jgi:hypothetical protein